MDSYVAVTMDHRNFIVNVADLYLLCHCEWSSDSGESSPNNQTHFRYQRWSHFFSHTIQLQFGWHLVTFAHVHRILVHILRILQYMFLVSLSQIVDMDGRWLVGGLEHQFYFPILIGFLIIPIDFHIFQRGGPTTNQLYSRSIVMPPNMAQ